MNRQSRVGIGWNSQIDRNINLLMVVDGTKQTNKIDRPCFRRFKHPKPNRSEATRVRRRPARPSRARARGHAHGGRGGVSRSADGTNGRSCLFSAPLSLSRPSTADKMKKMGKPTRLARAVRPGDARREPSVCVRKSVKREQEGCVVVALEARATPRRQQQPPQKELMIQRPCVRRSEHPKTIFNRPTSKRPCFVLPSL